MFQIYINIYQHISANIPNIYQPYSSSIYQPYPQAPQARLAREMVTSWTVKHPTKTRHFYSELHQNGWFHKSQFLVTPVLQPLKNPFNHYSCLKCHGHLIFTDRIHPVTPSYAFRATPPAARSVFDWSELMDSTSAWAGREWFVVRKAEVRLAEAESLTGMGRERGIYVIS